MDELEDPLTLLAAPGRATGTGHGDRGRVDAVAGPVGLEPVDREVALRDRALVGIVPAVLGVEGALEEPARVLPDPEAELGRIRIDRASDGQVDVTRTLLAVDRELEHSTRPRVAGIHRTGVDGHCRVLGCALRVLVHEPVAVVIDAVAAFVGAGVNQRPRVVAVGVVGDVARGQRAGVRLHVHVAVAVDVGVAVEPALQPLVDRAVAVVVLVVADLHGSGMTVVVRVVAVGRVLDVARGLLALPGLLTQVAVAVGVGVAVPDRSVHRILVLGAVAVVVDAVAGFGGTRVDVVVAVVAVGRVGHVAGRLRAGIHEGRALAVAVTVRVAVPGRGVLGVGLVGLPVAVVVVAVAHLGGEGVDRGLLVVAVVVVGDLRGRREADQDRLQRVAIAVAVAIEPARLLVLDVRIGVVGLAVAVVVDVVTDLRGRRVDVGPAVVAVGLVGDRARRLGAGLDRAVRIAVAVAVVVRVVGDGVDCRLVGVAVAVVVVAVTVLGGTRVDVAHRVVTVGRRGDVVVWLRAGSDRGRSTVAVLIAVEVPGREVRAGILVDRAVAVVVDAVAAVDRTRVDAAVGVVAVAVGGDVPERRNAGDGRGELVTVAVVVIVGVPGLGVCGVEVDATVAVVIDVVADLLGSGVHPVVEVVAVVVVVDVAGRRPTGDLGRVGRTLVRAVAVRVAVRVPGGLVDHLGVVVVHVAVAVVVDLVADLLGLRVDVLVGVVAVLVVADRVGARRDDVGRAVVLVRVAVAVLVVVGEDQPLGAVLGHDVGLAVLEALVDVAVAVVVHPVAGLVVPRENRGELVVAVDTGREAVAVAVTVVRIAGEERDDREDDEEQVALHDLSPDLSLVAVESPHRPGAQRRFKELISSGLVSRF